jgi:hypothetical protein
MAIAMGELRTKFELLYKPLYEQRALIISGEKETSAEYLQQYETRKKNLQDSKYNDMTVTPVDVKALMDNKNDKSICDFWPRVLATNSDMKMSINEKDADILKYITDI